MNAGPRTAAREAPWTGLMLARPRRAFMSREHTKGKRRSTKDKHDEGQRKKTMSAGGEKGDKNRKRQKRKRQRPTPDEKGEA